MAISKKEIFKNTDIYLSDIAKALSHPARIEILRFLSQKNSCMCGDIVNALPLAQSTVSQHLKELKRVGLIEGEIDGPKICYCLNKSQIEKAYKELSKLFNKINCC